MAGRRPGLVAWDRPEFPVRGAKATAFLVVFRRLSFCETVPLPCGPFHRSEWTARARSRKVQLQPQLAACCVV